MSIDKKTESGNAAGRKINFRENGQDGEGKGSTAAAPSFFHIWKRHPESVANASEQVKNNRDTDMVFYQYHKKYVKILS